MTDLLQMGASALKKAALNEEAKAYILSNKPIFEVLKKAANRYIGGENLEETIQKVIQENQNGFKCSIEFMGESTRTLEETQKATDEFLKIAQQINKQNLNSTISLDLSHIGLAISKELCLENISLLCEEAQKSNTEVIISAEGVERTSDIINTYQKASKNHDNLSITMQAYLHRSKDGFFKEELIKEKGRIRVVKGAFETPAGHSLPRGKELDEVYLDYVAQLLAAKHKCAIATHHHEIQQEAKKLIQKYNPSKDLYEFESLYGIQTENLSALKSEGFMTKLYFVYGEEWYLYVCNRIAEYPLNLFRALQDIVK